MVVDEALRVLLVAELLERVGPQDVAHEAVRRRLAEAVDLRAAGERLVNWGPRKRARALERGGGRSREEGTHDAQVVERVELGREAAVDAQELLVHDGGERERAERLHARVVDLLRVLVLACARANGSAEVSTCAPKPETKTGRWKGTHTRA